MEWRDIQTAPRDGTWVLLFCPSGFETKHYVGSMTGDGWWITSWGEDIAKFAGWPSHWQPLTTPPVTSVS